MRDMVEEMRRKDLKRLEQCTRELEQEQAARKKLEAELVLSGRLRAVGTLSAGVIHNLNNLLAGMMVPAEMLQMASRDPKLQILAGMVLEAGNHAADLVRGLHSSVREARAEALAPVALNQVIEGMVQMARPKWKDEPEAKGLAIDIHAILAEIPPIMATPSGVHDLLINLLFNAVDAMPVGGRICIRTALESGFVRLDFGDTGTGMDEQTRLRIFEPFFTTKTNTGTGLGLSTLYNSVTAWGGTVAVESSLGRGTTFSLLFPVWKEAPGATPESGRPVNLKGAGEAVKARFLGMMSERVRTFIKEEMEFLGILTPEEIDAAHQRILQQAAQLGLLHKLA